MPPVSLDDLLSRLKKGKPIPAILLLGEEPYLRDICRARLIDQYVSEAARTWAVSRFSAERGGIQAALDQAQTLPMLSPQQVVFLLQQRILFCGFSALLCVSASSAVRLLRT